MAKRLYEIGDFVESIFFPEKVMVVEIDYRAISRNYYCFHPHNNYLFSHEFIPTVYYFLDKEIK